MEHICTWYLESFEGRNNSDVLGLLRITEEEYIAGSNWTSEKKTPEDTYKYIFNEKVSNFYIYKFSMISVKLADVLISVDLSLKDGTVVNLNPSKVRPNNNNKVL